MKKTSLASCFLFIVISICFSSFFCIHSASAQTPTYTVGGTVSGLAAGKSVVLKNNTTNLPVLSNGSFTFPAQSQGTSWNVSVAIQPGGQACKVLSNASGTNISANVTDVAVSCVTTFTVGGSISGLGAAGLVLKLNNAITLVVPKDATSFKFASGLINGAVYSVAVGIQPPNYKCTVTNGQGTVNNANITNVSISCLLGYTVGGTITGLNASGLVLDLNNSVSKVVQNGTTSFSFSALLTPGTPYSVRITSQPTGKYCYLTDATGIITSAAVTSVKVNCSSTTHVLSYKFVGLRAGNASSLKLILTPPGSPSNATWPALSNNGQDTVQVTGTGSDITGSFTLKAPLGFSYSFEVTSPYAQQCTPVPLTGTVSGNFQVVVTCVDLWFVSVPIDVPSVIPEGMGTITVTNTSSKGTETCSKPIPSVGTCVFGAYGNGEPFNIQVTEKPASLTCNVVPPSSGTLSSSITVNVTCVLKQFKVSGVVVGNANALVLTNNGGDSQTIPAGSGSFEFSPQNYGSTWDVQITSGTSNQRCYVFNHTGTLTANYPNVNINCADAYSVGGTVSGLGPSRTITLRKIVTHAAQSIFNTEAGVELSSIGVVSDSVASEGTLGWGFSLSQNMTLTHLGAWIGGSLYGDVIVGLWNSAGSLITSATLAQSNFAALQIEGDFGYMSLASNVNLLVGEQYTIGAFYTGGIVVAHSAVVSPINGLNFVTPSLYNPNSGGLTQPVAGSDYDVFSVLAPNGFFGPDLRVAASTYGDEVEEITVAADGLFTFPSEVASGDHYSVVVVTQPYGQVCVVNNGSGTVASGSVSNIVVTCPPYRYALGGALSGLASGKSVTLSNGSDSLTLNANGSFAFSNLVAYGQNYDVTIATQPSGQHCSVTNGQDVMGNSAVTNVTVFCTSKFTVGGTLAGLIDGGSVTLSLNDANNLILTANGSWTFSATVDYGQSYNVKVVSQPSGQICVISNPLGTMPAANVTNVTVTCITQTYSVGGSVAGLGNAKSVWLQLNGANTVPVGNNGTFVFSNKLSYGSPYHVTVITQPVGQTCLVNNGSGTVSGDVTNVYVSCTWNTYTISGTNNTGAIVSISGTASTNAATSNSVFTFIAQYGENISLTATKSGIRCVINGPLSNPIASNVSGLSVACNTGVYTLTSIPTSLSGIWGFDPTAINNNGDIAGTAYVNTLNGGRRHAAIYTNGSLIDLGALAGDYVGYVGAINDQLQVVGYSNTANSTHAFLSTNGLMKDLGTLSNQAGYSYAFSINNQGDVVGNSDSKAFLYKDGVMTSLGVPNGDWDSTALDVNIAGQVVGYSNGYTSNYGCCANKAFLFSNGMMAAIGSLGGRNSYAVAINDAGQVVGRSEYDSSGNTYAFSYSNGIMTDLGALGGAYSEAKDINNSGIIIGNSNNAAGQTKAFVYRDGQMTDLSALVTGNFTGALTDARAINNKGQILVSGKLYSWDCCGNYPFLLTPSHYLSLDVKGLAEGSCITVNDGSTLGQSSNVCSNGATAFSTALAEGSTYNVTVTQPVGQTCLVANGTGTVDTIDIIHVSVACNTAQFKVSGTVSGHRDTVTLTNNGGDTQTVTVSQNAFTFTSQNYNTGWNVLATAANEQKCVVDNSAGSNIAADQVVNVYCVYTISGVNANGATIQIIGTSVPNTTTTQNVFSFDVMYGETVSFTVADKPGSLCTVNGAPAGGITGDVSGLTVTCTPILYSATDLGNLGLGLNSYNRFSYALAINNQGQVVGYSSGRICPIYLSSIDLWYCQNYGSYAVSIEHGFLYSNGAMTDLGTLNGTSGNSRATAINNNGQIVGYSDTANGYQHAFLYSNGAMTDLGALAGITGNSQAFGINNSGQIVGQSYSPSYDRNHAFLYTNGAMSDLGALNGYFYRQSTANAINGMGVVAGSINAGPGYGSYDCGRPRAFMSTYGYGGFTAIGYPFDTYDYCRWDQDSVAYAINSQNQVVGYLTTTSWNQRAFLYSNGIVTELGSLSGTGNSIAYGINNIGQVVGTSDGHAFLYSGGQMTDLNMLLSTGGIFLSEARGINRSGQIVANGNNHAYLLTPVAASGDVHQVAVTVSGLGAGKAVTLRFDANNGISTVSLTSDGTTKLVPALANGATYVLSVINNPIEQTCWLSNASGTMGNTDITVAVTCQTKTYTIGGSVSGLANGETLVLFNNDGDAKTINSIGTFIFDTALPTGATYNVAVGTNPTGRSCNVTNNQSTVAGMNVTNIIVVCSPNTYTLSGTNTDGALLTASGSTAATGNAIRVDGSNFSLSARYLDNITFTATKAGNTCYFSSNPISVAGNVTGLVVTCGVATTSIISGKVIGHVGWVSVRNNGGDQQRVEIDGSDFTFPPQINGSTYSITTAGGPAQTCAVTSGNASGILTANIYLEITCAPKDFTISVVNTDGASVQIINSNGININNPSNDSVITFNVKGADAVSLIATKAGYTCLISGTVIPAKIMGSLTGVVVGCTSYYTVGGTVTGNVGEVTLTNNGGNAQIVASGGGSFTFAPQEYNTPYNVVASQPTDETCLVFNGSGAHITGDVTVTVTCAATTYQIGGTISNLATGTTVTLAAYSGDPSPTIVPANGAFTLTSTRTKLQAYAVAVTAQPVGYTCTITGGDNGDGSGTVGTANVTSVLVDCATLVPYTLGVNLSGVPVGTLTTPIASYLTIKDQDNHERVVVYGTGNPVVGTGNVTFGTPAAWASQLPVTNNSLVVNAGNLYLVNYGGGVQCTVGTTAPTGTTVGLPQVIAATEQPVDPVGTSLTPCTSTVNLTYVGPYSGTTAATYTPFTYTIGQSYSLTITSNPTNVTCSLNDGVNPAKGIGETYSGTFTGGNVFLPVTCEYNAATISGTITGYGTPITTIVGGVQIEATATWPLCSTAGTCALTSVTPVSGGTLNDIQPGYQVWMDSNTTVGAVTLTNGGMGLSANTYVSAAYVPGSSTVQITTATTMASTSTLYQIVITGGGVNDYKGMKLTVTGTAVDNTPISYTTDALAANATTLNIPTTYLFKAGTSYNVTISTAPQYAAGSERTCTVYNGSGVVPTGTDSTPVINNLVVDCGLNTANSRLVVGNSASIQTTAVLALPTAPVLPGGAAYSAVTFPDIRSINTASSALATSGSFLTYVLNSPASGPGSLAVLQVSATTGATTAPVATAPAVQTLSLGNNPYGVAVSNGVVIATNTTDNNMTVATNTGPGTLTLVGNTTIGTGASAPRGVAFHPSNGFAYVVASGNNAVYPFTINMGATALADKVGATSIATGATPYNIAVDSSGRFAYVTNYGAQTISMYSICQFTSTNCVRGTLSSLGTVPVLSANPLYITADASSVLVVTELGDVYHYAINTTSGVLTLTANSLSLGAGVTGITLGNSRNVFYVNGPGGVAPYSYSSSGIGAAGTLITISNAVGASLR